MGQWGFTGYLRLANFIVSVELHFHRIHLPLPII